jgi:transposase
VLVEGQVPKAMATAFGVTVKTVRKWLGRFRAAGSDGLLDGSSRAVPAGRAHARSRVERIEALRCQRSTGEQIAREVGVSPATVSRILKRLGLNKLKALEPAPPIRRCARAHPGELIHIDIKKFGRIGEIGHASPASAAAKSRGVGQ